MMQALILAGGSGTRFWPLSRKLRPKQLLALEGEKTLLRETLERLSPLIPPHAVWIATTEALAHAVRCELAEVPASHILIEPEGRNTAPAIGWAVRSMPAAVRAGVVAVLPADHRMGDPEAFRSTLERAGRSVAERDLVMTLGIEPRRPETGYGYLELAPEVGRDGERRVRRFVEKPSLEKAREFLAAGNYLWNGGIFVFRGTTLLAIMARLVPELARGLEAIAASPDRVAELYRELPSISIDYAVMERIDDLVTLPLDCGWSDLGSWEALAEILPADPAGNAARGEVVAVEAADNLLFAETGTIAVVGVSGLVVVKTGDAVLVIPKERSQEVRKIVAELGARGRDELL